MLETIICSALHIDDLNYHINQPINILIGFVVCGRRHSNCFDIIKMIYKEHKLFVSFVTVQGFLTNTNRFVDRLEAYQIAKNANQIKNKSDNFLYSEDLY
jgi:hypothetical protein